MQNDAHLRLNPAFTVAALAIGVILVFIYNQWPFTVTSEHKIYQAGNRYFEDGHYQHASENFKQVLEQDPANIEAIRGLARSYMQMGKYQEALALFNQAIALQPDYAPSYANRGILHDRMQQHSAAVADYRKALQLQPKLAKGPGWLTRFLRNQPEKPPSILDRLNYLQQELQKPAAERLLQMPAKDQQQQPYKFDEQ